MTPFSSDACDWTSKRDDVSSAAAFWFLEANVLSAFSVLLYLYIV